MYIHAGKVKTKIENFKDKLEAAGVYKKLKKNAFGVMMFASILSSAGCATSFSNALESNSYEIESMIDENNNEKDNANVNEVEIAIEYNLPITGIALTDENGVITGYDLTVEATETIKSNAKEGLVYNLIKMEDREIGVESSYVRTDIPVGEFVTLAANEAGNYMAEIKGVETGTIYGVVKNTSTKEFGPSHGTIYGLPMTGIALTNLDGTITGYDITVEAPETILSIAKEDLIYNLIKMEDREVGVESSYIRTNIPVGEFVTLAPSEAGNYMAEIKGVETGTIYGVVQMTTTDSFGPSHGNLEDDSINLDIENSGRHR